MEKIIWTTEKRKINELAETEYNPRTLNKKQYKELKKSIDKFDLAEIPAINTNNTILAGHMRLKLLREKHGDDHLIDVRVPNRLLNKKEADEYMLRSNKNTGEWDFEILANNFDVDDLKDFGFEDCDLGIDIDDKEDFIVKDTDKSKDELEDHQCPKCGFLWKK